MELSRRLKILIGIATGWPIIWIFAFLFFFFGIIFGIDGPGSEPSGWFFFGFFSFIIVHLVTVVLTLALTVFYIIHAVKNEKLESNMRIVWILMFFFFGMVAEPIYWYFQIWKEPYREAGYLQPPRAADQVNHFDARRPDYVPPNEPPDWR